MADRRDFRAACHELARRTGGTVGEVRIADGVTPNFDHGVIAYRDRSVALVHVRDTELFAFAEPKAADDSGALTFLDEPELAATLADLPGIRPLTKAELDARFVAADWPGISANDVKYWRPHTVGEALFNHWD